MYIQYELIRGAIRKKLSRYFFLSMRRLIETCDVINYCDSSAWYKMYLPFSIMVHRNYVSKTEIAIQHFGLEDWQS